jgi:hypothetical protein
VRKYVEERDTESETKENGEMSPKKLVGCRVARFFLLQNTKMGKMYQNGGKYTKWP